MEHPTDDELSSHLIDPAQSASKTGLHLQDCAECRQVLEALQSIISLVAESESLDFPSPTSRVWEAINTTIDAEAAPRPIAPELSRHHWTLRTSRMLQIAAVGLLIGLLGGWMLWGQHPARPTQPHQTVLASAALHEQDSQHQRARAKLVEQEGRLILTIEIQGGSSDEALTVWLSNPKSNERVQVGLIDQSRSTSTFSIPRHLVNDGFKLITLSRGVGQQTGSAPSNSLATGLLQEQPTGSASTRPTKSPAPSPAPSSTPRATPSTPPAAIPSDTNSPGRSNSPTLSAPGPSISASPKPRRTPKPTPSVDPARSQLRQQAKACRTLLATPRTGTVTDREQRLTCRELLREWRAQRATPLPQPRSVDPDQLQPEVLPQPSQT